MPAAVLIATPRKEQLILDWIYVREECRRKGIGKRLLTKLLSAAYNLPELEGIWTGYTYEYEGMENFLDHCGFYLWESDGAAQFTARISDMSGVGEPAECKQARELEQLSKKELNAFYEEIFKRLKEGKKLSIGVGFPIKAEDYMPESAALIKKECIEALLLLKKAGLQINVAWVYSSGKDVAALIKLFRHALYHLNSRYGPDTELTMSSVNSKSLMLIRGLFPKAKEVPVMSGFFPF